jgi:predicted RNA methylase
VARRAAQLLGEARARAILDIGSGPGKFCIVGALSTAASFTGVERRAHLVDAARDAAARLGARRARFVRADILDFDFSPFDGFYLFNPFFEQLGDRTMIPIDGRVEHSRRLYQRYVRAIEHKLADAAPGAAVVTYYGFGGVIPPGYTELHDERAGGDRLVLWQKE